MSPIEEHAQKTTGREPLVDLGPQLAATRQSYVDMLGYVRAQGADYYNKVASASVDLDRFLKHYGDAGVSALLLESLKLSFPKE